MLAYACPALYALFLWWFGTGAVLFLDGLPTATFPRTMMVATLVFILALLGMIATAGSATVAGAYAAFTFGFFAWGWQEISFYLGYVTGPRRHACREGCSGWPHFLHGVQVTIYHEIKILLTAGLILLVCFEEANPLALWSFLTLWAMHQSAKLNVFLGVPNLSEDFLPDHLLFLRSFLTRRPMNLLFPLSVTMATVTAAWMIGQAAAADPGSYEQTADTFLATLLVVGVLEHWFLVLPLPTAALWEWGLKTHGHHHQAPEEQDDDAPVVKSVAGSL